MGPRPTSLAFAVSLFALPLMAQPSPGPARPDPCVSPAPPAEALKFLPADSERAKLVPQVWLEWTKLVCDARARKRLEPTASEGPEAFAARAKKEYGGLLDELDKQEVVKKYYEVLPQDKERYIRGHRPAEIGAEIGRNRPRLARSVEAASTNPLSVGLIERSGVTDLVSLATQGTSLVAADQSAVTLNLGAAALFHALRKKDAGTSASRYRDAGFLNRLAGSVTFGSKIPEKALTGLSGLPTNTDTLFDAVVWDVKARLVGDRDPRAEHWDDLLLGQMGGLALLSTIADGVPVVTDLGHRDFVDQAMTERIAASSRTVARRIGGSLQISAKFSGQHLTTETGKNKYTAVLMLDKGLGPLDGTLNASYSSAQNLQAPSTDPFTLKRWTVAGGSWAPSCATSSSRAEARSSASARKGSSPSIAARCRSKCIAATRRTSRSRCPSRRAWTFPSR